MNGEAEWQVFSIDVDEESGRVADKMREFYGIEVAIVRPKVFLCADTDKLVNELERAGVPKDYSSNDRKYLFIGGDGNYHHLTYALTRLSGMKGYGVFDADAHTDDYQYIMGRSGNKFVNCENFTELLMEDCGAAGIAYFGVENEPNRKRPEIRRLRKEDAGPGGIEEATKALLKLVPEKRVYATLDLDVLDARENTVRVNPLYEGEGSMGLEDLIASIKAVRENKELFAADICGHKLWGHSGNDELMIDKSAIVVALMAGELMGLDTAGAMDALKRIDLTRKA